jgi:hypothetical protein
VPDKAFGNPLLPAGSEHALTDIHAGYAASFPA